MTVATVKNKEIKEDACARLVLVLPPSNAPELKGEKLDFEVSKVSGLGKLVPVVMPKSTTQDVPEEKSKELIECELYAAFNEAIEIKSSDLFDIDNRNSRTRDFIKQYIPEAHGVQRGEIPPFLTQVYEEKVGKGFEKRVDELLTKSETLMAKGQLGVEEAAELYSLYVDLLALPYQKNLANSLLFMPEELGEHIFTEEQLSRVEKIAINLTEKQNIMNRINEYSLPDFESKNLYVDNKIAEKFQQALFKNATIEKEHTYRESDTIVINNSEFARYWGNFRKKFSSDVIQCINEIEQLNVGDKFGAAFNEHILHYAKNIQSVSDGNKLFHSILERQCNRLTESIYSKEVEKIFENEKFWEHDLESFRALLKTAKEEADNKYERIRIELFPNISRSNDGSDDFSLDSVLAEFIITKSENLFSDLKRDILRGDVENEDEIIDRFKLKNNHLENLKTLINGKLATKGASETLLDASKWAFEEFIESYFSSEAGEQQLIVDTYLRQVSKIAKFAEAILSNDKFIDYKSDVNQSINAAMDTAIGNSLNTITRQNLLIKFEDDPSLTANVIERRFEERALKLRDLPLETLPEKESGNYLYYLEKNVERHRQILASRLKEIVAIESIFEEILENGRNTDPQVISNILENTVLNEEPNNRTNTIEGILRQFQGVVKNAIENGQQLKLEDLRDILYGIAKEEYGYYLPIRLLPLIESKIEDFYSGQLNAEQTSALFTLFNDSQINPIDLSSLRKAFIEGSAGKERPILEKCLLDILRHESSLRYSKEDTPDEKLTEYLNRLISNRTNSDKDKLGAVVAALLLDKGINPLDKSRTQDQKSVFFKGVGNEIKDSSLNLSDLQLSQDEKYSTELSGLFALNMFSELLKSKEESLGGLDELILLDRLYGYTPREIGAITKQLLDTPELQEKKEDLEKNLSELFYKCSKPSSLYEQLHLSRLLNPGEKSGIELTDQEKDQLLEFVIGFAGSNSGEHRSQLEVFHKLTNEHYRMVEEFSDDRLLPLLKDYKKQEENAK